MRVSYHGKSKTFKGAESYTVIREHFIGKTLFGYVIDLNGQEMLLSKRFPDNGRSWRYVAES